MAAPMNECEWLEKLVGFDTTSRKPNLPLIEYVAEYFQKCGVTPHIVRSPDGIHANLLATLPASDGSVEGGLILSGHSDVVPVDGQKWDTDPFQLTEKDGKLYGRGSCDMKGFIAVALSLVPEWVKRPRAKPIHITLTYNEETNFEGVRLLMREAGKRLEKCEGCIVGEPTSLDCVISHKGISLNCVTVRGKAAHSSLQNSGCNAIESGTRLLSFLFALRDRFASEGPFEEGFEVCHTTLCPSLVSGGIAMNTIPEKCNVGFEFRNIPGHEGDAINGEIEKFFKEQGQQYLEKYPGAEAWALERALDVLPFRCDPSCSLVKTIGAVSEPGRKQKKVSYCSEAGEFQALGINTVVCGPGDIAQAHKANEFIEVEQMKKGVRAIRQIVEAMCIAGSKI